MRIVKEITVTALVLVLAALFVWGFIGAAQEEAAHNARQINECRRLGGFAQTSINGRLDACRFPHGAR
jgi:hypothetical protein